MSLYNSSDATITTEMMISNINRVDASGNGLLQFKLSSDGDIEFRDNSANWVPLQFIFDQLTSGQTLQTSEARVCPIILGEDFYYEILKGSCGMVLSALITQDTREGLVEQVDALSKNINSSIKTILGDNAYVKIGSSQISNAVDSNPAAAVYSGILGSAAASVVNGTEASILQDTAGNPRGYALIMEARDADSDEWTNIQFVVGDTVKFSFLWTFTDGNTSTPKRYGVLLKIVDDYWIGDFSGCEYSWEKQVEEGAWAWMDDSKGKWDGQWSWAWTGKLG